MGTPERSVTAIGENDLTICVAPVEKSSVIASAAKQSNAAAVKGRNAWALTRLATTPQERSLLSLMVRSALLRVSNHEAPPWPHPSRRGEGAAPQDEAIDLLCDAVALFA